LGEFAPLALGNVWKIKEVAEKFGPFAMLTVSYVSILTKRWAGLDFG
jgi:hypothetical protein